MGDALEAGHNAMVLWEVSHLLLALGLDTLGIASILANPECFTFCLADTTSEVNEISGQQIH